MAAAAIPTVAAGAALSAAALPAVVAVEAAPSGLFSFQTLYSAWRRVQALPAPQKALVFAAVAGVSYVVSRRSGGGSRRRRGKDGDSKDGKDGDGKDKKREVPFQVRLKKILKILFSGKGSKGLTFTVVALTAFLIARTILSIQVAVTTGEVAEHLVQGNWERFLSTVGKFALIGVPAAVVNSGLKYFSKTFALQSRRKLTEHINAQYITGVNFYKANYLPASKIDNVDQRVTTDVENFCSELAELYTSIFKPLLDIILNTLRLYTVMGAKASLIWFVYYLVLAQLKRRMLKILELKNNTKKESELQGDYRTAHSRLITYAEEIAFFEGAPRELTIISSLAQRLFAHSAYVHKLMIVTGIFDSYVNKYGASITGYALLCLPVFFPMDSNKQQTVAERTRGYVLNRQLLMDLAVGIGMLLTAGTQVATFAGLTARVSEVLEQVKTLTSDTTSNNFKLRANEEKPVDEKESSALGGTLTSQALTRVSAEWLADWKAKGEEQRKTGKRIVTRVPSAYGLAAAAAAATPSGASVIPANPNGPHGRFEEGPVIKMIDVSIVSPDGRLLAKNLNIEVPTGNNVMITGPNGCGKSSMFRVLGELWPPYEGTVVKPPKDDLVFVPQKPYLVLGSLREQIIYPHSAAEMKASGVTDDDLAMLLTIVDPAGSILREWKFDDVKDWTIAFSGGQKQRVALARVFYHRPRYAILDECTSAVSSEVEGQIYQTCAKLGITLFTISHRPQLQAYHEFQLRLDGHGGWNYVSRETALAEKPAH